MGSDGLGRGRLGVRARSVRIALGATMLGALLGALVWTAAAAGTQPQEAYESAVTTAGSVAVFPFGDPAGSSTIEDSIAPHTYTATNDGVTLGGEGPFPGSRSGSFGSGTYATLPSDPLAGAEEFTAEAWVDWAGEVTYMEPIFDFGSSASTYMYLTPASDLGKHDLLFEIHPAASSYVQVAGPARLAKNAWEYLAVTETASGTLSLYVNGALVGQTTGATIFPSSLGSAPTDLFGKSLVSGEPNYDGGLSDVAFYTEALSAEQIREHYYAGEFPFNTSPPTISGAAKEGDTLTAREGSWSGLTPISFFFQWQRCNAQGECPDISGATGEKYEAAAADVGSRLRVLATGKNEAGKGEALSAETNEIAGVPPKNSEAPKIEGKAEVGQLLEVTEGEWTGTPATEYTYEWENCSGTKCTEISGATESSYRVTAAQFGHTLVAVVTDHNPAGKESASSQATAEVVNGPPVNLTSPVISGDARERDALDASTGTWAGSELIGYSYQWEDCKESSCHSIAGATEAGYVARSSDVGSNLRVKVTAENSVESVSETSETSAAVMGNPLSNLVAPEIKGEAREGQTLSATSGTWEGIEPIAFEYQWESCDASSCSAIPGATVVGYQATGSVVGDTLRVAVTATNPLESGSVQLSQDHDRGGQAAEHCGAGDLRGSRRRSHAHRKRRQLARGTERIHLPVAKLQQFQRRRTGRRAVPDDRRSDRIHLHVGEQRRQTRGDGHGHRRLRLGVRDLQ